MARRGDSVGSGGGSGGVVTTRTSEEDASPALEPKDDKDDTDASNAFRDEDDDVMDTCRGMARVAFFDSIPAASPFTTGSSA
mmetsp:Transcript_3133/g.6809  ORF Transcript_3133/g.6809 Transcript_3133/m.6809 type:complete len:82 (+) Transcript_3133:965-1210(+)